MATVQTIPVHRPIGPFLTNWESYIALCSPTHKGVHRWERFRKFNLKRVEWAGKVKCVRDRSAIIEMDFLKDEQPIEITLNFTQPQIFQEYSEELEIYDISQDRLFSFRAIIILQDYTKPPKFNLAPRNKSTEPDYTLTFKTFASEVYGDSKTSESVYFEKIFKNRFVTLVGGLQALPSVDALVCWRTQCYI
ncbi:MAG: hypothetical protein EZS28_028232 [Streblomastix strix]|uniref:Uncharacterized protein n=1 Tax=Streblomastix strix TaxID=222440 RepID=A0A5J4V1A2_9EUKA|nr:MAG: hypothetical protein EZS28_028232 [Streblomastix strix]